MDIPTEKLISIFIGIIDINKQNNRNSTIGFRNKQMLFFKSVYYEKHTNITNNQINMKMTDTIIIIK
jgi:hypothetical protein